MSIFVLKLLKVIPGKKSGFSKSFKMAWPIVCHMFKMLFGLSIREDKHVVAFFSKCNAKNDFYILKAPQYSETP